MLLKSLALLTKTLRCRLKKECKAFSYEWMLTNPDEYQAAFNSDSGMEKQNLIGLVNQAIDSNLGAVSGLWGKAGIGRVSGEGLATKALIDQIKNSLTLEARQKLKGQGQISDAETAMLANSVSKLIPGMPQEALKKELGEIKNILEGKFRYDESGYQKQPLSSFIQ